MNHSSLGFVLLMISALLRLFSRPAAAAEDETIENAREIYEMAAELLKDGKKALRDDQKKN